MTTTTRKPTKKQTEKQIAREHEALVKLVTEFVLANGGTDATQRVYSMSLPTEIGTLCISVHDDWLACRFDDINRAVEHFGSSGHGLLNPHSGKWNWGCGSREPAADLFARWSRAVTELLPKDGRRGEHALFQKALRDAQAHAVIQASVSIAPSGIAIVWDGKERAYRFYNADAWQQPDQVGFFPWSPPPFDQSAVIVVVQADGTQVRPR